MWPAGTARTPSRSTHAQGSPEGALSVTPLCRISPATVSDPARNKTRSQHMNINLNILNIPNLTNISQIGDLLYNDRNCLPIKTGGIDYNIYTKPD